MQQKAPRCVHNNRYLCLLQVSLICRLPLFEDFLNLRNLKRKMHHASYFQSYDNWWLVVCCCKFGFTPQLQDCIPVGCIPPACWPYPPACTVQGECLAPGGSAPGGYLVPGEGGAWSWVGVWCWGVVSKHALRQTPPPWTEFLTHATENVTLPQTSFAGGNKDTSIGNSFAIPQAKIKNYELLLTLKILALYAWWFPTSDLHAGPRNIWNTNGFFCFLSCTYYSCGVPRDLPWSPYVFVKANYVNEPQGCDIFFVLSTFTHINTFLLMLRWDIRGIASFVRENLLCELTKFPFAIYFTVNEKRTTSNCGKNRIITFDNEFQICFKYTF